MSLLIEWVNLVTVREKGKISIALYPKQVVHVTVKLSHRDHIHVPLARVGDESPDLFLRESSLGVHEIVAGQLDARFGVKVILVGFPPSQEIDLALDFGFRW